MIYILDDYERTIEDNKMNIPGNVITEVSPAPKPVAPSNHTTDVNPGFEFVEDENSTRTYVEMLVNVPVEE